MRIGITGANGLLGFHARCVLAATESVDLVRLATRDTFASTDKLEAFVHGLDGVMHFAGVNRGDDVYQSNVEITSELIEAMKKTGSKPAVAYANSTHLERDTAYGRGKRQAGELLKRWADTSNAAVGNFILPHVFGEFGKPCYNSVVSTFCHQLAIGEIPRIDNDGQLELLHAQNAACAMLNWLQGTSRQGGDIRVSGAPMRVSQLLEKLQAMTTRYLKHGVIPSLDAEIDLCLFNTLRGFMFPALYPHSLKLHTDARGALFEAIKADQGGQVFMSTTVPEITRGNHWHMRKVERFLVVAGRAEIRLRKLFSDEVIRFSVSGDAPSFVDIPTMYTHSITNTGDQQLNTLFWTNEIFDPQNPDTYPEAVLL